MLLMRRSNAGYGGNTISVEPHPSEPELAGGMPDHSLVEVRHICCDREMDWRPKDGLWFYLAPGAPRKLLRVPTRAVTFAVDSRDRGWGSSRQYKIPAASVSVPQAESGCPARARGTGSGVFFRYLRYIRYREWRLLQPWQDSGGELAWRAVVQAGLHARVRGQTPG